MLYVPLLFQIWCHCGLWSALYMPHLLHVCPSQERRNPPLRLSFPIPATRACFFFLFFFRAFRVFRVNHSCTMYTLLSPLSQCDSNSGLYTKKMTWLEIDCKLDLSTWVQSSGSVVVRVTQRLNGKWHLSTDCWKRITTLVTFTHTLLRWRQPLPCKVLTC